MELSELRHQTRQEFILMTTSKEALAMSSLEELQILYDQDAFPRRGTIARPLLRIDILKARHNRNFKRSNGVNYWRFGRWVENNLSMQGYYYIEDEYACFVDELGVLIGQKSLEFVQEF